MFISNSKKYFLLRNEGFKIISHICSKLKIEQKQIQKELDYFVFELQKILIKTLKDSVPEIAISFHELEELENKKAKLIAGRSVISLDSYSLQKNAFHLGISRLYDEDGENKIKIGARPGFEDLDSQIKKLLNSTNKREFVLVDDDIWTGGTMKDMKKILEENGFKILELISGIQVLGNVEDIQARAVIEISRKNAFDIADPRDFLLGSKHGGLGLLLKNGERVRAPYFRPFTNPHKHVGVPENKVKEFSLELLDLNLEFYTKLSDISGQTVLISNLDENFQNYVKFKQKLDLNTKVLEYIQFCKKMI
jgi:hypothetical protein